MLEFRSVASSSRGNVNVVTDGQATIMLDCGLAWKKVRQALCFKTSAMAGVLLTHEHKDHSHGVREAAGAGVDVYMLRETREALGLSGHRFHDVQIGQTFRVGPFSVVAFPLLHDVPCCGFLVAGAGEKLAYITDTSGVPGRLPALNLLAVECNYCEDTLEANAAAGRLHESVRSRVAGSHFGLGGVLDLLRSMDRSRLQDVYLLHLSDANADVAQICVAVEQVVGAGVRVWWK